MTAIITNHIHALAYMYMLHDCGLRQLSSGKIYRKVGRADCGNNFWEHALREIGTGRHNQLPSRILISDRKV